MAPRIREGDQGANKKGIKAFSPRRRKERKGRQEIQASMLLLSVFAVKILGFGGFCKQGKKSAGGGYCSKKMPLPRNYTEKKGKEPLSVIFANGEIHIYSKARMDPRIREGDQSAAKGRALDGRIIKENPWVLIHGF